MNQGADGSVTYINPATMHKSPAFTQAIAVTGPAKTIYVGAQFAVDGSGAIVGRGDIAAQTEQCLKNTDTCLEAAGARPEHVISLSVYVAQGQDMARAAEVGLRWWGQRPNPPTNTVMFVAGFWPADILIAIEAVAVVPGATA
jgi:enamine deaminase RidA (YjgF/YER057c/UK114 family)